MTRKRFCPPHRICWEGTKSKLAIFLYFFFKYRKIVDMSCMILKSQKNIKFFPSFLSKKKNNMEKRSHETKEEQIVKINVENSAKLDRCWPMKFSIILSAIPANSLIVLVLYFFEQRGYIR